AGTFTPTGCAAVPPSPGNSRVQVPATAGLHGAPPSAPTSAPSGVRRPSIRGGRTTVEPASTARASAAAGRLQYTVNRSMNGTMAALTGRAPGGGGRGGG